MKTVLFVAGILLTGIGLIVISGCGDDDPTSPVELTEGNPNDPAYEIVSDIIGQGNFEFDLTLLELSFGLLDEQTLTILAHYASLAVQKL